MRPGLQVETMSRNFVSMPDAAVLGILRVPSVSCSVAPDARWRRLGLQVETLLSTCVWVPFAAALDSLRAPFISYAEPMGAGRRRLSLQAKTMPSSLQWRFALAWNSISCIPAVRAIRKGNLSLREGSRELREGSTSWLACVRVAAVGAVCGGTLAGLRSKLGWRGKNSPEL